MAVPAGLLVLFRVTFEDCLAKMDLQRDSRWL